MFRPLRVAAISFVPEKFELADNCDRLEERFRRAARDGAELAVAPEGVIEGYVTNEIIAGEAPAARIREVAVTMQGAVISRFRALARELGMSLAFGCAEQVGRHHRVLVPHAQVKGGAPFVVPGIRIGAGSQ